MVRKTTKKKAPDKNRAGMIFEYLKDNPIVLAVVILVVAFFFWKLISITSCKSYSGSSFSKCLYIDMVK